MDFDERDKLEANLVEVLHKHFQGINDAKETADELCSHLSVVFAIQDMESQDRPPEKDIENLDKAAAAIDKSVSALRLVGRHGCADMGESLQRIFSERWSNGFGLPGSSGYARDHLIEHLEKIHDELLAARDGVDANGASFNTALGEGEAFEKFSGIGKQRNSAAQLFADELAKAFYDKTGKEPKVNTNPYVNGNPAYGAFLDFVSDAFHAANISAKPEYYARKACKDFSPDNR